MLPKDLEENIIEKWIELGVPSAGKWASKLNEDIRYEEYDITKSNVLHALRKALADEGYESITAFRENYDPVAHVEEFRDPTDEELDEYLETMKDVGKKSLNLVERTIFEGQLQYPDLKYNRDNMYPEDELDQKEVYQELIQMTKRLGVIMDKHDPVITSYKHTFENDGGPIAILFAGCMHMGGRWTFHDMIQKKLDEVLSHDKIFLAMLGDEIDGFNPFFFNVKSVLDQPLNTKMQKYLFKAFMAQIHHKVLFSTWSQHGSLWNEKRTGSNPLKDMYIEYKIPYFDGKGYVGFTVGEQTYHVAVSHEFPGSSIYNPTHAHIRALRIDFPSADAIVKADKHQYAYMMRQVYLYEAEMGLRASPWVHFLQVGTAKSGLDPYSIRGWSRGQSEYPYMIMWPDVHHIEVTRDFNVVRAYLDGTINLQEPEYMWQ